jgi:hypothetical protein
MSFATRWLRGTLFGTALGGGTGRRGRQCCNTYHTLSSA